MSRTFFIPKATVTTTTESIVDMPNDDLDAPVAPAVLTPIPELVAPNAPLTASFTEILSEDNKGMRRSILNSFAASLNLMLVNAVRNHLIFALDPRNKEQLAIDARAEDDDRRGINAGCYGTDIEEASANYAGNRTPMRPMAIASRLGVIRQYVHMMQSDCRSSTVHAFEPRPLSESTDWLRSQQPTSCNEYDAIVRTAYAANMGAKTLQQCVAERNAQLAESIKQLQDLTPEIISMGDALTACPFPDAQYVEQVFDELPPHVQCNLYIAAMNGIATAYKGANTKLLRYGNISAGGDIMLLRALHNRARNTLKQLLTKHSRAIEEYEERGAELKTLKPLV